jgi:hypothetical protein
MMHGPLSRTTKWETSETRKSVRTGNRQDRQRRCIKIIKEVFIPEYRNMRVNVLFG